MPNGYEPDSRDEKAWQIFMAMVAHNPQSTHYHHLANQAYLAVDDFEKVRAEQEGLKAPPTL